MPDIFNDYDEQGYRLTAAGTRSHKAADANLLVNLRFAFGERVMKYSDQKLVNEYDEFAMSDMYGDNNARFLEWLETSA